MREEGVLIGIGFVFYLFRNGIGGHPRTIRSSTEGIPAEFIATQSGTIERSSGSHTRGNYQKEKRRTS